MTSVLEAVEAAALRLPPTERARLVERLIASLETDPEVERAWAVEVERRNAELEAGAVSPLSGPETIEVLKTKYK